MTSRDRTALFLRYRQEAKTLHAASPHAVIAPPHPSTDAVPSDQRPRHPASHRRTARMRPDWAFVHADLKGDIVEMRAMLAELSALHAKHLLPSFGDVDTSRLEHDIRLRSQRLTDNLRAAEHKLRAITTTNTTTATTHRPPAARDVEAQILRNMQKRFASPLQQLSLSFRNKQKAYLLKLQDMRESLSEHSDPGAQDVIVTFDADADALDPALSESQLLTVEGASGLARERTRELRRVVANVNDLATLVKDLAALVVDQGTVLDRIDYNLEHVKVNTFGALSELRITDRNERKRHAVCCIIVLSIACGIMFIILIYKWTS
ncbi:unnamed protein product [Agarophyton chilense]